MPERVDLLEKYRTDKVFRGLVTEFLKFLHNSGKTPEYAMQAMALAISFYRKDKGMKVEGDFLWVPGGKTPTV